MHKGFGLPYAVTTTFWVVVLAVVFFLATRVSTRLIFTASRRAVAKRSTGPPSLPPSAHGTAVDFTASTLGLGYLSSAIFFCGFILIPWFGLEFLRFNAIFAFWFAYVLTRPVGASFADYFSKGHDTSGLGFGNGPTALVLTLIVVVLVAYTARARETTSRRGTSSWPGGT